VIGAVGQKLFGKDLPDAGTTHWPPRKKAEVVAAISGGLISVDDVLNRYGLSVEELSSWQRSFEKFGMAGLRTTRTQHYRDRLERIQQFGWVGQS